MILLSVDYCPSIIRLRLRIYGLALIIVEYAINTLEFLLLDFWVKEILLCPFLAQLKKIYCSLELSEEKECLGNLFSI